jgi:hypothetical protein
VQGEAVLVEHLGEWLPGTVLWEYLDTGRPRALVRFQTVAGLVIRQLRWSDELRPYGRSFALPLFALSQPQDGSADVHPGDDPALACGPVTTWEECVDAISSWKAAERAYRKELDRYISVGWGTDPREFIEAEVMTPDVLERLRALREAIDVAQAHYEQVCAEIP